MQKDMENAKLQQLSADRLSEIEKLTTQLNERNETDGPLHSGGEAPPTDPIIQERRLREELAQTKVDLQLSKQCGKTAKTQASQLRARILELEAKISQIPEEDGAELELLRANAERDIADLKKAREESEGARSTLFGLERAFLTEIELDEMTKRYGEKEKECDGLKDEVDRLRKLLANYDEEWELDPYSEPQDALSAPVPLHAMDRVQRKRTADEALFAVDPAASSTKRLKLSTEIDISSHVSSSTGDFYAVAHNMVLREAARGGLINPLHFKVGQHGLVGITELARQRLELANTMSRVPYDKWKVEKEAELTQRIRGFMSKMGFFEYGHKSMIGLRLRLRNPDPVSSGFLVENFHAIIEGTTRDHQDLRNIRLQLQDEISLRPTTENAEWLKMAMEEITMLLTSLFSRYGDEQLPTGTRAALNLGDYKGVVSETKKICDKYDELVEEYHRLKADSKVPDCYFSALDHVPPE